MRLERIISHDVVYQFKYPEEFQAVLRGDAYWYPHPIEILGHYGKFFNLWSYTEIDMDHPRCYYCGKFVKKGDWWKSHMTGPCPGCDDLIDRYGLWT